MTGRPTVSVALCTHNGERFIGEQLQSILGQTELPSQVVVSDDASTDRTLEIVRETWARLDPATAPQLVVLRNEPALGVVRNFERAVTACAGELIALSDQDDLWFPSKLGRIVDRFAARAELGFVFTDARLIDAQGADLGPTLFEALEISSADLRGLDEGRAFATLLRRNLATGATVVFRRTLLDAALPFDEAWVHDEWLAIIAAAVSEVEALPEQTIGYRQHGANQIGVSAPTLRYKIRRVLQPRGERYRGLRVRAEHLLDRLTALGLEPARLDSARAKVAHESSRAALPANRLARVPPILREVRTGRYGRYSSQGMLDVLRDLLQPGS